MTEQSRVFSCKICRQWTQKSKDAKGAPDKCNSCALKYICECGTVYRANQWKCTCGKQLRVRGKGNEEKLARKREAGSKLCRNPGYALEQLQAAAAFAYGAGYGVFCVAFRPGKQRTAKKVFKEGLLDVEGWRLMESLARESACANNFVSYDTGWRSFSLQMARMPQGRKYPRAVMQHSGEQSIRNIHGKEEQEENPKGLIVPRAYRCLSHIWIFGGDDS